MIMIINVWVWMPERTVSPFETRNKTSGNDF